MVIFHSYVKLPEGTSWYCLIYLEIVDEGTVFEDRCFVFANKANKHKNKPLHGNPP